MEISGAADTAGGSVAVRSSCLVKALEDGGETGEGFRHCGGSVKGMWRLLRKSTSVCVRVCRDQSTKGRVPYLTGTYITEENG